jgi:hypothetical protein
VEYVRNDSRFYRFPGLLSAARGTRKFPKTGLTIFQGFLMVRLKRKLPPVEIYTPERKAEFLLNNSVTKEGYDEACRSIREDFGLDPARVPHADADMRATLPTPAEFDEEMKQIRENLARRRRPDR